MARDQKVSVRIGAKDEASRTVERVESRFKRMGTSIKANALKITAILATVVVAFKQIEKSAGEVGRERALERNLAAQGIAIDEFVDKLKDLSDNQIATNELILASNRAVALGIRATDLPGLMTVAANAAVELGISTTQAFNDITTGVGRASPLILDNLGIVVDAVAVYASYAASIGTTTEALTKQQKTIALTKAVIEGASGAIEDFETKQDSLTRSINRADAAFKNVLSGVGSFGGGLLQLTAAILTDAVFWMSKLAEEVLKVGRTLVWVGTLIPVFGKSFEGVAASLAKVNDKFDAFQVRAAQVTQDLKSGSWASIKWSLGIRDAGDEAGKAAPKMQQAAKAVEEVTKAEEGAIEVTDRLTEATKAHTAAMVAQRAEIAMSLKAFEDLRKEKGEQVAIDAALAAGATLTQGGTRIRFGSTGSRLVNQGSDSWITNLSGGTFYRPRKPRVLPDGSVEFD